jgi:hypothetical protein
VKDSNIVYNNFFFKDTYADKGWPKSAYAMSKLCINVYARVLAKNPEIIAKNI